MRFTRDWTIPDLPNYGPSDISNASLSMLMARCQLENLKFLYRITSRKWIDRRSG